MMAEKLMESSWWKHVPKNIPGTKMPLLIALK